MTISKRFLITLFALVFFTYSQQSHAETAKAPVAMKAEVKAETKAATPAPTTAPAKPATAAPTAAAAPIPPGPDNLVPVDPNAPKNAEQRASAVVDLKNLPQDVSNYIPQDGEPFVIKVGETRILTAARPRKCLLKDAPTFDETVKRLPTTDLISYSDGGVRLRLSNKCGGLMNARVVLATGVKAGTDKLGILNNILSVMVK